jgi:hypothetical protein
MTDPVETRAPERIWAWERDIENPTNVWTKLHPRLERAVEYIRADAVAALVAEAVAQEREACAETAYQAAMRYEGTPLGQASDGIAAAIRARK